MPARPFGRSLADFGTLKDAEQKLLRSSRVGEPCVIAKERPSANGKTAGNTVRAGFLRFLILGGDDENPAHEHGVRLQGAWIDGVLDLDGVASSSDVCAVLCWFDQTPVFRDAHVKGNLMLNGSRVPGLRGDRLTCDADVFCTDNFISDGEFRLLGAAIGANFTCAYATFNGPLKDGKAAGYALSADRINVEVSVFLGRNFIANGTVRLLGAVIGGDLGCLGARFNTGAAFSLLAEGMSVAGTFFFRGLEAPADDVNLSHARVRVLADDKDAWGKNLNLDGFTYERIGVSSPTNAKMRLEWLDRQRPEWSGKNGKSERFRPQPWLQLRKALREAGHPEDATKVGIAFQRRRRRCGQIVGAAKFLHFLYGAYMGYGYRPYRLPLLFLGVWLYCGVIYDFAAYHCVFVPASPEVYQNPGIYASYTSSCWVFNPPFGGNYPAFHPFAYSLNVFLPVLDLGQQAAWEPAERPFSPVWWKNLTQMFTNLGGVVQLIIWMEAVLGWGAGLVLVGFFSSITGKQDDI